MNKISSLNSRDLQLFAVDCAEHAIHPNGGPRSRWAAAVAESLVVGQMTPMGFAITEVESAEAVANAAAGKAADRAAEAIHFGDPAWEDRWEVTWWDAWKVERAWQTARLQQYLDEAKAEQGQSAGER